MKKVNSFEGFYEDEESLKMLDMINKNADKEYVRIKKQEKKDKIGNLLMKVFIIASLMFVTGCLVYISSKSFNKNVEECVGKGYEKDYCEYQFSK